ncbi:class I SAM-dependent methyltransferase [uncultured Lacinutrix sp.]|uniref:class I SAM-dependent methyltransferase n=1 Tax=uncultured Lacinutrix sp. TaxID=574032 RepID=UPI00262C7162|nr:class I SAM-dependent methyltransferase [uncultured Lacinutrix sp.]
MNNKKNIKVHETAFVTSTFRSINENLSHDVYAKLWCNARSKELSDIYLNSVSTEEVYTHCLRNRYFLDKIKELISSSKIEVLINFGSGFSMYPFLLDKTLINIEIDKPEIVDYKKNKIEYWQNENVLPNRNIHFIGVDFSKDYVQSLLSKINTITKNKTSFILIEGVLFFLNRTETNTLFQLFETIQNKKGFIGSVSFQKSLKDTVAFKRLLNFMGDKMPELHEDNYQTIENDYYKQRPHYKLIDHQDYFTLSKTYNHQVKLEKDMILNEHFYLLEKTNI